MPDSTKLNLFMTSILSIKVQRMGGAFAGIMGASGADNDILNKLKRAAIAYAREYTKAASDKTTLSNLSEEMYGYFQTLQLTYTLTEEEANKLIDDLQVLSAEI
jgi:hypothetical protein